MAATAGRIADALRAGIARNGRGFAALSGGSTPEPAYRALAAMDLDWRKITFALVDERFVGVRDPASNEGLIERVLDPAFQKGAQFKPMYFATGDVENAADSAEMLYAGIRFDVALMGMGEDGHTASWFPGARGLDAALDLANPRSVISIHAPQAAGSAERLTLTRSALSRTDRVLLLITGDAKRAKLKAAQSQPLTLAPVAALFADHAPEVLWAP
jgi:6-phosphogluconolactonase